MQDSATILEHLKRSGWVPDPIDVIFLAAGEYNENHLVRDSAGREFVFRINHGSQLGLDNQIEYEFNVLRAVAPSGVTPRPFFFTPDPVGIGGGALLMEYLPGKHLDYYRDRETAADIFSRIHSLPPSDDLIIQANPVLDIANECRGLLLRYPDHHLIQERKKLLDYHDEILLLGNNTAGIFDDETLCIVNTEVNSHNFLIGEGSSYLVDWEKAVVSYRYQDLAHFIAPTTTLWKSDYRYSEEEKLLFLKRYREGLGLTAPLEEIREKTRILERTILLRGLSWCFMACYEYAAGRVLGNRDTFKKIRFYMNEIDWFLDLPGRMT